MRETHRKVARTVSNVLALMDEDPDFTYAMSSAPNSMRGWNRNIQTCSRACCSASRKDDSFPSAECGVESDNMLPTGESLIRQITFGMRYFRENLGVEPKGLWLPDSFGYCGAWPQIARRAGFEWFLTQKDHMERHHEIPRPFLRMGRHRRIANPYALPAVGHVRLDRKHAGTAVFPAQLPDKDLSRNASPLYGYSDGGGGPTWRNGRTYPQDHDLAGAPSIDFGTPDELFDRVRHDLVD